MKKVKDLPTEIEELIQKVKQDGGEVLAVYEEPYGLNWQLFVKLPIDIVKPTPYQRDLSNPHVERLRVVIETIGRFLDPIILVRAGDKEYWTPNGNHRREAMVKCGKEWITGILIPDQNVAFQILALNTEKAHNLKEKSLEVIRMYRALMEMDENKNESDYSFQLEEPAYITLGIVYEKQAKFAGGAYHSFLKKIDNFLEIPIKEAYIEREKRSQILQEVDEIVVDIVIKLKERGISHPFVKNFVVSKCNPLGRKRKTEFTYEEAMEKFKEKLQSLDIESITLADIMKEGIDYEI
ncbi:MAG: chromosome partitioning protein ParB [candidate division WOR-3 bacterium]